MIYAEIYIYYMCYCLWEPIPTQSWYKLYLFVYPFIQICFEQL